MAKEIKRYGYQGMWGSLMVHAVSKADANAYAQAVYRGQYAVTFQGEVPAGCLLECTTNATTEKAQAILRARLYG